MELQKTIALFLLLCYLISITVFVVVVASTETCFTSACSKDEPVIRFPFHLRNYQSLFCGYPGFILFCDASNRTIIRLPGEFTVQAINYTTQELWLNDPNDCLPQLLMNLNLSASPFSGVYYQDFTLFNCSFDSTTVKNLNPIACLSGSNYTVYATSSMRGFSLLSRSECKFIGTIPVPVQWPFFEQVMSSGLSDDIRVTWYNPDCRACESGGGRCAVQRTTTFNREIICENDRGGIRFPKGARYAIIVGAGVPGMLFLIGLLCFLSGRIRCCRRRSQPVLEFSSVVTPQPIASMGLDGPTIESYPKTILGESRRLPKPDDTVCTICLAEYQPKETLRTIPECQHCFHADCIDEWLRLNASCPVCRNSPMRVHAAL